MSEAITYGKQGSKSWGFDYRDADGCCMQVALVSGKVKARRVLQFLQSTDLRGKKWDEVAVMIRDFRAANKLTFSDPHPRGRV